jgi:hypothetical protein
MLARVNDGLLPSGNTRRAMDGRQLWKVQARARDVEDVHRR